MKKLISLLVVFMVTIALYLPSPQAQTRYTLQGGQELAVLGTSTMHNWEMVTYEAIGEGLFWIEDGKIKKVEDLVISFEAASLESGRGRIMDRNARRALKAEDHPEIIFKLLRLERGPDAQTWAHGELTAAGNTRPMKFKINYGWQGEGLDVRAKASFKLTDYEIEPPVALAGTLRTGDAVSLDLVLSFKAVAEKLD